MATAEIIKPLEVGLATLRQRVEAITVRNAEDYVAVCELVKEGRSYIKDVGFKLDPGISSARDHLDFLRQAFFGCLQLRELVPGHLGQFRIGGFSLNKRPVLRQGSRRFQIRASLRHELLEPGIFF